MSVENEAVFAQGFPLFQNSSDNEAGLYIRARIHFVPFHFVSILFYLVYDLRLKLVQGILDMMSRMAEPVLQEIGDELVVLPVGRGQYEILGAQVT